MKGYRQLIENYSVWTMIAGDTRDESVIRIDSIDVDAHSLSLMRYRAQIHSQHIQYCNRNFYLFFFQMLFRHHCATWPIGQRCYTTWIWF